MDFERLYDLHECATSIARSRTWDELASVFQNTASPISGKRDFDALKDDHKGDLEKAKDDLLFSVIFRELKQLYKHRTLKPKKRGRKGDKIQRAFEAITSTPQDIEKLAEEFEISIAVLNQHRRFDKTGKGMVHTKTLDGRRVIWREKQ